MNNRYKIKFTLDGESVNPAWGPEVEKVYELEEERLLYRERLNGLLIWARGDFPTIRNQDLEHEFDILIERMLDTGLYESYIAGVFTKINIQFNDDRRVARGPIRSIDKYEDIMAGMDREFDLLKDLAPPASTVMYKKQPLLQLFFPGHPKLFNMVGQAHWISDVPDYQEPDIIDFGFATTAERYLYIPGSGDMTPNVGGFYEPDTPSGVEIERWTRIGDGAYRIVGFGPLAFPNAGMYRWRIERTSDDEEVYRSGIVELTSSHSLFPTEDFTFNGSHTFVANVNVENKCRVFAVSCFQRLLTDLDSVYGNPTIPIPTPDVADIVFGYSHYVDPADYEYLFAQTQAEDPHSVAPTEFGKYVIDALHWADEYFAPDMTLPPFDSVDAFPLFQDSWREYSMKMYRSNFGITLYQSAILYEGGAPILNRHCYKLGDAIKEILAELDPDITFELTSEYSQLLFDPTNPVSGLPNYTHFITPKTNVLVTNFDNAATRAPITLGQCENLLRYGLKAFWFIDEQNRFRIEHVSWFKNGGSYYGPVISVDLTTHISPQLQRAWDYHTRDYRYKQETLHERENYDWGDEVTTPFKGLPIEMLSSFVTKGDAKDYKITAFTSDIDYGQAVPEQINKDGFFILSAELVEDEWVVPFETIEILGLPTMYLQNGFWSFYYLHEYFHRHNLPSKRVKINGLQTSATTTRRAKELDLVFPAGIEPPPLKLIVTGLGLAEVASMGINMNTRKATLKLLLDLDFENPCPCEGYFREASYVMPIASDEDDLSDVTITSILIDGQEFLDDPVFLEQAINVVSIGGEDWVTNLADAINGLGIPNLTSPYPEAGDFANGMTQVSRFCRLRFPECSVIQITILRGESVYVPGEDDGLSVRWLTGGHQRLDGETWVNADLLAPFYSFVWEEQPRLAQIYVPCL